MFKEPDMPLSHSQASGERRSPEALVDSCATGSSSVGATFAHCKAPWELSGGHLLKPISAARYEDTDAAVFIRPKPVRWREVASMRVQPYRWDLTIPR